MSGVPPEVIRGRAAAYDTIYRTEWQPQRVTREWYERRTRYYLEEDDPAWGHSNGNEITFALNRLDVDHLAGKTVLDFCCGTGLSSLYLALRGARVYAFDASAQAIATAMASARLSDLEGRVCFAVTDAQYLPYPDDSIDLVFCQSALHIVIDYPRCAEELARVLKPTGKAVFCEEALAHNPFLEPIRWLRRRKYAACGGRTLSYRDLHRFGQRFERTEIHHFNLLAQVKTFLGSRGRQPWAKAVLRRLDRWDKRLLQAMPTLKRFCGKVAVEYCYPRSVGTRAKT